MERETRFELATLALARRCSTTELLPLTKKTSFFKEVAENVPLFLPLCPEALFPPLVDLNGRLVAETCGCVKMWHAVLSEPRHRGGQGPRSRLLDLAASP